MAGVQGKPGWEKGCRGGGGEYEWSEGTENERGRWRGERAEQTLNDFHCFQKLSYQRDSPGRRVYSPLPIPFSHPSRVTLFPSLESPSTPSIEPWCAVYKPCATRNGTSFELFLNQRTVFPWPKCRRKRRRLYAATSLYEFQMRDYLVMERKVIYISRK